MKGIAFDLEGTIIDVEAAHHEGHLRTAHELGLDLTYEQAIAAIPAFVGGPDRDIAIELAKRSGAAVEWVLERMRFHYLNLLETTTIAPRSGFLAFLTTVHVPIAIGSVTPRRDAMRLMRAAGIDDLFDALVFAEDVARPKPAPDVYLETARRLGIAPADQLVFEDSARGVSAALTAGSHIIALPTIPAIADRCREAARMAPDALRGVYMRWEDVPR